MATTSSKRSAARRAGGGKRVKLAHQLIRDIARMGLGPGARLGTEQELVERHELSRSTVRQALDILEREGFISRKQRSGTFIKRPITLEDELRSFRGTAVVIISEREDLDPDVDLASFTIFQSIVRELGNVGFGVQVVGNRGDAIEDRRRLRRALEHNDVECVCSYAVDTEPYADLLDDLPVVVAGTFSHASGMSIGLNYEEISYALVCHLLDRGHRDIDVICGPWVGRIFADYVQGYRRAHDERGVPFRRDRLHLAYEGELIEELAHSVLSGPSRPTAVFAEQWRVCEAVLSAASREKLSVPDNLSVVSCGQNIGRLSVPITAYVPDNSSIGRQVAELLIQPSGSVLHPQRYLPGEIVEHGSVRDLIPSRQSARK